MGKVKTMPSPETDAATYGAVAVRWATELHSSTQAFANAKLAAHKGYLAIGRPRGTKRKVVPIFDKKRDYGKRLDKVHTRVPEPQLG